MWIIKKTQYGGRCCNVSTEQNNKKIKIELFAKKCCPFKQPMVLLYMV